MVDSKKSTLLKKICYINITVEEVLENILNVILPS